MKNRNKSVLKMAPPWIQYVNKITALFGRDPEVLIDYDNDEVELKLRVTNPRKADALIQLLPPTREFGGVQLKITVISANLKSTEAALFKDAFYGNPAVSDFVTVSGVFSNPISYMIFDKRVVQYYDDDIGDYYGNHSTLYADLADEIFDKHDGVFFCTDVNTKEEPDPDDQPETVFDKLYKEEGQDE